MSDFSDFYEKLIIFQYSDKPKAKAEIGVYSAEYEAIKTVLDQIVGELDVDTAQGIALDRIGKIVGLSRTVQQAVGKAFFGFQGASYSAGYGEAPWFNSRYDNTTKESELSDPQYKQFIKLKVIQNTATTALYNDEKSSLQDAVSLAFNNKAYVRDNFDMTIDIVIDNDIPQNDIDLVLNSGILPKPQGVEFKQVLIPPV